MGPAAPFIMAGAAVVGAAASISAGQAAKKDAARIAAQQEELARKNAANIEMESRETERRAKIEQERNMAQARAKAAASGVATEGSLSIFMEEQESLFAKEIDWLRKATASQAEIARMGGQVAGAQTLAAGRQAQAQGFSSALSSVQQFGSVGTSAGWW